MKLKKQIIIYFLIIISIVFFTGCFTPPIIDNEPITEPTISTPKNWNNTQPSSLKKIGEVTLSIPGLYSFSPKIANYPKHLKLAFIEFEPPTNSGNDVTKESIKPLFDKFKFIMEEIYLGKISIDSDYSVSKIKLNKDFDLTNYMSSVSGIVEEEITKLKLEDDVNVLIAIPDVGTGEGLSLTGIEKQMTIMLPIWFFQIDYEDKYTRSSYSLIHELLHNPKFGENKDAYSTGSYASSESGPFPWYNLQQIGIFGTDRTNYPIGPILVQQGIKEYKVLEIGEDQTIQLEIENSCMPSSKIHKIPLGYVVSQKEELLQKSLVLEARGDNDCTEIGPTAGVYAYVIFESIERVEYSYDIPFVHNLNENGKITELNDGKVFAKSYRGNDYAIENGLKNPFITEYSSEEFDIKLLEENVKNNKLISSTVSFKLKQKEQLDFNTLSQNSFEIFNYDNMHLIIKRDWDKDKTIINYRILINDEEYFKRYSNEPEIELYCITSSWNDEEVESCKEAIKNNFGDVKYRIVSLDRNSNVFNDCSLQLSFSNNLIEPNINIDNFINPECS